RQRATRDSGQHALDAADVLDSRLVAPFLGCRHGGLHRAIAVPAIARPPAHVKRPRSKRPRRSRSGAQRSPRRRTRAGTLSGRKSSVRTPSSISRQLTGVETHARGLGRTEYTEASVRPQAFWL